MPSRKQFKTKEEYNAWFREYRKQRGEVHRKYIREYNRAWRKKNGYHNEENSKKRYPEKTAARQLLVYAIKRGQIKRGKCRKCKKPNAQGHHNDYTKPLKVIWLCPLHHTQYHAKMRSK